MAQMNKNIFTPEGYDHFSRFVLRRSFAVWVIMNVLFLAILILGGVSISMVVITYVITPVVTFLAFPVYVYLIMGAWMAVSLLAWKIYEHWKAWQQTDEESWGKMQRADRGDRPF